MTAPNSAERRVCWDARDLLWKCLDDNHDSAEACQKQQSHFQDKCPAQWVSPAPLPRLRAAGGLTFSVSAPPPRQVRYFSKRRDFLKYKERIQTEGFTPAEGPREKS